jgi:hypothetical protein
MAVLSYNQVRFRKDSPMHPAAADLPPIAILPSTDAILLEAARDIAVLGGGCLAIEQSPIMVLALPSDAWGRRPPMILWNERLVVTSDVVTDLYADDRAAVALGALGSALDAAFDRLRQWRWSGAESGSLCAITDGTGLALMLGPAAAVEAIDLDWLMAAAAHGAVTILPFADDGLWALLDEPGCPTLH